ncbi:MAG: acyltransferase family protein [Candidatus Bathyarchaeota archaeon]|nr:acyltransferase family protein [Candidatus Bathyarchaeota archaeon]
MQFKPAEAKFPVDLIRTIAIVMIIAVHTSGFPYRILNAQITTLDVVNWFATDVYAAVGMFGVPLFVMLTGALLLNPNKADEPLRVFYKKRLNRIGLPFVFWTIVYFLWSFRVLGKPLTLFNLGQSLLSGSYAHLWYLYLLMGLYSVTPVLRVLVKHLNRGLFAYLIALWFVGTVSTTYIHVFTEFEFNPVMFVFFDWIGYYLLGIFLLSISIRRQTAYLAAAFGFLGAIVGDWLLTATAGEHYTGYFHSYMSATVIVGAAGLFFLLVSLPSTCIEGNFKVSRVIHWIGQNTLPIYLIHIIVMVSLTNQVFGVYLNSLTYMPLVDVPVFTFLVFSVSAIVVYALKKIPYVKKLIG